MRSRRRQPRSRPKVSNRQGLIVIVVGVATLFGVDARADQQQKSVTGVMISLADIAPERLAKTAGERVEQTSWQSARIEATTAAPWQAPEAEVEAVFRAYLEADFLRCLGLLQQRALQLDQLLEHQRPDLAARLGLFAAACAHGSGAAPLAREMLRRLYVLDLSLVDELRKTPPVFQALAEAERRAIEALTRKTVQVRTTPATARISVDGVRRCTATPCVLHLRPGEHVIVATHIGFRSRAINSLFDEDQTLTLVLDPAPSAEVRQQLATALGESKSVDSFGSQLDTLRASSAGWGARLVMLLWRDGGLYKGTLYDRLLDRHWHQSVVATSASAGNRLVDGLLTEWEGVAKPRPLYRQPLFWLSTAAVAAAIGTTVWFFTRPPEIKNDIVFRGNP